MNPQLQLQLQRPTGAFVGASWTALLVGAIVYLTGLWNSDMQLNEKGYYFVILMYGLFSAVSLQKSVRDIALFDAISPPVHESVSEA